MGQKRVGYLASNHGQAAMEPETIEGGK